ncbi:MAG: PEP-CTERM sorting domain-containing protein [Pirellulales bacterium]
MIKRLTGILGGLLILGLANRPALAAVFHDLGVLPGGFTSRASAVSGDGTTVVGSSDNRAFRWTAAGGLQDLGSMNSGQLGLDYDRLGANGVSYNGAVVVGAAGASWDGYNLAPFRWTAAGMERLVVSLPYAFANAVSADGSVAVGYDWFSGAFRHVYGVGNQDLPAVENTLYPVALGVSGDGSIVVGHGNYGFAFKYVAGSATAQALTAPAGWSGSTAAYGISGNGQVIVGTAFEDGVGDRAVRWTPTGFEAIPSVPGVGSAIARAASYDGSVVVGESGGAMIWDAVHGSRDLKQVLENDYGVNLAGWSLSRANSVSYDGTVIAGDGYYIPSSQARGWVVNLPPQLVPGDVDANGKVDIFDVAVLQTKYGMTSGATWADGDFDGNGTVDIFDVAMMQVNYGHGVATSPAPVPEPSTFVLAVLGVLGVTVCCWRRRKAA